MEKLMWNKISKGGVVTSDCRFLIHTYTFLYLAVNWVSVFLPDYPNKGLDKHDH